MKIAAFVVTAALAGVAALPASSGEPGHDALLDAAREARAAGDLDQARGLLRQALRTEPDSPDALLLLGLIRAREGRYESSADVLERVLTLAPDYADARIALARVRYWQGQYATAERILEPLSRDESSDAAAQTLAGRIAWAERRPKDALAHLRRAVRQAPDDPDAHIPLGDALLQTGDRVGAREAYARAEELGSRAAAQRLQRLRSRLWRMNFAASYSDLSGGRDPWRRGEAALSYQASQSVRVLARAAFEDRGFASDTEIAGGFAVKANDWSTLGVELAGTPSADFRPDWQVSANAGARVRDREGGLGASWVLAWARHSDFPEKSVQALEPGLRQYFLYNKVTITGRAIIVRDSDAGVLAGWRADLGVRIRPRVRLTAITAVAPESERDPLDQSLTTVDTRSWAVGLAWEALPWATLRLGFEYADREDSFRRRGVALAMAARF